MHLHPVCSDLVRNDPHGTIGKGAHLHLVVGIRKCSGRSYQLKRTDQGEVEWRLERRIVGQGMRLAKRR